MDGNFEYDHDYDDYGRLDKYFYDLNGGYNYDRKNGARGLVHSTGPELTVGAVPAIARVTGTAAAVIDDAIGTGATDDPPPGLPGVGAGEGPTSTPGQPEKGNTHAGDNLY